MKIDLVKNKIIVYLKKDYIEDFEYNNVDKLEEYFKNIFMKLNIIYDIKLLGFYIINIYIDEYYGSVIEIIDEDIEYDYDEVNMKINLIHNDFLYQVDNYIDSDKYDIYIYKNKLYLKIKNELNKIDMLKLLEFSKIIYDTEDIILCSKKI